ncbi:MAG: hypothetical protein ACYTF7_12025, partial [Planctomycetota bacterium]
MQHEQLGHLRIENGHMVWIPSEEPLSLEEQQARGSVSGTIDVLALGETVFGHPDGLPTVTPLVAVFDDEALLNDGVEPTIFRPRSGHVLSGPILIGLDKPEAVGLHPVPLGAAIGLFASG